MSSSFLFDPAVNADETNRVRFEVNNALSLALGAAFLGTGIAKVAATDFVISTFKDSGLGVAFLVVLGLVEMTAAVLTIIPTTRLVGTSMISAVMLGALGYHVMRLEPLMALVPLVALATALISLSLEIRMRRDERLRTVSVCSR